MAQYIFQELAPGLIGFWRHILILWFCLIPAWIFHCGAAGTLSPFGNARLLIRYGSIWCGGGEFTLPEGGVKPPLQQIDLLPLIPVATPHRLA
jgi:hypothetical protein